MSFCNEAFQAFPDQLTDEEMRAISGGAIWDKFLTALLGITIGAFYDMGKQEGKIAREQVKSIFEPV